MTVLADVVRPHHHAVLRACTERLWPDADAAVAAAARVLVSARLAMADPALRPGPEHLRGWLVAIAAQARPRPGQPARIDDVDWAAVRARLAAGPPAGLEPPAPPASSRHWLERLVSTLPEPRQRMYDLFVTKGLDSRNAAAELGTTVTEVRRLRRENRQAILRAVEVTALAAAEDDDPLSIGAPGCAELRPMLADARGGDADPHEDGRARLVVLSAALRLTLSRHLSDCRPCQRRRDVGMARWAPELLPILAEAELHDQVIADAQSMPELRRPGSGPGAHRRVAPAAPAAPAATRIVIGRPALAAAGTGLGAALLLIAFVWPGVVHGTRTADVASPARNTAVTGGADAPTVAGPVAGPDGKHGRPSRSAAAGVLSTLPPTATESPATSSSASVQPSVYYTVPPSTPSTSSPPAQSTSSPSPSAPASRTTSPTPSASATTSTPTPTPTGSTATPTPTPTGSTATPTPTPSASTATPTPTGSTATATPTATPTASASTPAPTPSASASAPTSAAPTVTASTPAPSATT